MFGEVGTMTREANAIPDFQGIVGRDAASAASFF